MKKETYVICLKNLETKKINHYEIEAETGTEAVDIFLEENLEEYVDFPSEVWAILK